MGKNSVYGVQYYPRLQASPGVLDHIPCGQGDDCNHPGCFGLHSVNFVASVSHLLSARPGHAAPQPCSVFNWKAQ